MAVTYIDPGEGSLSRAFEKFGTGIALKLTEKQRREDELRSNPQQMQALAAAYRAANDVGQGANFLEGIGVRPEFGASLGAFQPGVTELTERAFIREGGPEATVGATIGQARVQGAEANALLGSGVINQRLNTEIAKLTLDQNYANAANSQGLGQLRASAEAAGFRFNEKEARLESDIIDWELRAGIPQARVNLERLGQIVQKDAIEGYQEYLSSLPDTPLGRHFKNMAAIAITNPGLASEIQLHERMDFESSMARAQATGDPGAQFATFLKWRDANNDAVQRLNEAESTDARLAAMRDINGLRLYGEDLIRAGAMLPVEITGVRESRRMLGLRSKIESFGVEPVMMDSMTAAAEMILSGSGSMEQLQGSNWFRNELNPTQRGQLLSAISSQQAEDSQSVEAQLPPELQGSVIQRAISRYDTTQMMLQAGIEEFPLLPDWAKAVMLAGQSFGTGGEYGLRSLPQNRTRTPLPSPTSYGLSPEMIRLLRETSQAPNVHPPRR